MDNKYLILSNGMVFEGQQFGAEGDSVGEIVFTTGMGRYIKTLSDPANFGNIVVQTFPLIGNYGIIEADAESNKLVAAGYVVREWCGAPSNFRNGGGIDAYLKKHGVVGICGVDTRELTRVIRENGTMTAKITDDSNADIKAELDSFFIKDVVAAVSSPERVTHMPEGKAKYSVAVLDCGVTRGMVNSLLERGCRVEVLPYNTNAAGIFALSPDGIFLSGGPGNPADNAECIETIKEIAGKMPVFGTGLGHQMLALAFGAKTYKMARGHRGLNQPVKDLKTGRVYITNQNHGYAVDTESLGGTGGEARFVNANDGTCEGIDYPTMDAFSVQFCPEGGAGAADTAFLFDRFCGMMQARGGGDSAEG